MNKKEKDYNDYRKRIKKETIPCYEPELGKKEIKNVISVIKSNWLSEGENVRKFEKKLSLICNKKYSLSFVNATSAMIASMKAIGIGKGDEVIVPSFAHCADPNAISLTGAKPIFADVDRTSMLLNLTNVKKKYTKKTKAILFVCVYGNMCGIEEIQKFCKEKNIFLLNDSAPALFGKYKNKPIASYGDCSYLSFFADKTITTGEGGMLLTNNKLIIDESNIYKHDGRKERGHDVILRKGYNFRFNEILASIGLAQLDKHKIIVKRKKQINKLYQKNLRNLKSVTFFKFNNSSIVPHRNIIFYKNASKLIKFLSSNGIGVRTLFMPMHSQPVYRSKGVFNDSVFLHKNGVCLPSAPSLKNSEVLKICNLIKIYINKNENITR